MIGQFCSWLLTNIGLDNSITWKWRRLFRICLHPTFVWEHLSTVNKMVVWWYLLKLCMILQLSVQASMYTGKQECICKCVPVHNSTHAHIHLCMQIHNLYTITVYNVYNCMYVYKHTDNYYIYMSDPVYGDAQWILLALLSLNLQEWK